MSIIIMVITQQHIYTCTYYILYYTLNCYKVIIASSAYIVMFYIGLYTL